MTTPTSKHGASTIRGRLLRCSVVASGLLLLIRCGPSATPVCSATDAGDPDFQCASATPVTLTQLQADVLHPTCAIPACHDGSASTQSPTNYSSAAATAGNVGKDSTYQNGLKVVDANKSLTNSTMWLKVLGGSPTYKSLSCVSVGGIMPVGNLQPIPQQSLNEIKGWICAGAPNN